MTSNIGSTSILDMKDEPWELVETRVLEALRGHFRPEFLNRVDEILVFRPLEEKDLERIVDLQLERLARRLREREIELEFTPGVRAKIAEEGYDPAYGARPIKRAIQHLVSDPLALAFLDGAFGDGDRVRAELDDGEIGFRRVGAAGSVAAERARAHAEPEGPASDAEPAAEPEAEPESEPSTA
jgi:ATP-dependent Clp protease ATP-binding subunit ClpB